MPERVGEGEVKKSSALDFMRKEADYIEKKIPDVFEGGNDYEIARFNILKELSMAVSENAKVNIKQESFIRNQIGFLAAQTRGRGSTFGFEIAVLATYINSCH